MVNRLNQVNFVKLTFCVLAVLFPLFQYLLIDCRSTPPFPSHHMDPSMITYRFTCRPTLQQLLSHHPADPNPFWTSPSNKSSKQSGSVFFCLYGFLEVLGLTHPVSFSLDNSPLRPVHFPRALWKPYLLKKSPGSAWVPLPVQTSGVYGRILEKK